MAEGLYTITFTDSTVAVAQDLLSILPAANRPVEICKIRLSQTSENVVTDPEQLRVALVRGNTTVGSGGASVTPVPTDVNAGSSGVTARRNDTTAASGGTLVTFEDLSFNIATGILEWEPNEFRMRVQNAVWACLRLRVAPNSSTTMSGTIKFRVL